MKLKKLIEYLISVVSGFFPIHLAFSHFKYNFIVLFYWAFLFLVINGYLGQSFGLQYLFLSPEYLGESDFIAFFLLGFSIGGFIMAFHTSSYIRLGPKYSFIATLSRPFFKFCINNSFIPIVFLVNIVYNIVIFQKDKELISYFDLTLNSLSFVFGALLFIMFSFLYFFPTNKDLFKITGKKAEDFSEKSSNINSTFHRKQKWYNAFLSADEGRYYYLGNRFRIKQSRSSKHYDIEVLNSVFSQNHTNASFFEIALIISFISIGLFKDHELFQVPSSVSIMMLLTIVVMIISAMFSWFRQWTYPVIIGILLIINYLSIHTETFKFQSHAFGLSYEVEDLVSYSPNEIRLLGLNAENAERDLNTFEETLINWKVKTGEKKPKLVILNTSGGGLRSAMWTFSMLQELDKATDSKFSQHLNMITGASGGMVGAAYYRDLMLREQKGQIGNKLGDIYRENISKDLLNRISFSISTSDIFFRFQKVDINGHRYTKDRGYAFEQELIKNLNGSFNVTLGDYSEHERNGSIPTMIFSPTVINDGRRLLISSQHIAFLNKSIIKYASTGLQPEVENIEYLKFFEDNNPQDILFTSVLRMNATFPYIMPMVTMPSKPGMQVMDAGMRDNYGTKVTVQYITALNKWIEKNTSGVIIVKIRDTKKVLEGDEYSEIGMLNKLLLPFGNMYGNFPRVQDFDQDELLLSKMMNKSFPIDVVSFNLREKVEDIIALSWHLSKREKNKIISAINSSSNREELQRLLNLLSLEDE